VTARSPAEEDLVIEVLRLSRSAWSGVVNDADIARWLENFEGEVRSRDDERLQALHVLRHFTYFGAQEVRELLRSMYRDLFRYPLVQEIRRRNSWTTDAAVVKTEYQEELRHTRFVGMGNPADSGSHLLYYFRQQNELHRDLFVYPHELLSGPASDPDTTFAVADLRRVVFVDDLLGSGQQAEEYSRTVLADLREVQRRTGSSLRLIYLVLFAKERGLSVARGSEFDDVLAVHELDDSQSAFSSTSRVYAGNAAPGDRAMGHEIFATYGEKLFPGHGLGYREGQMLLALHHNVPDNTLPVFWRDLIVRSWSTLFTRYAKDVLW
jgi:hypothetical protein